MMKYLLCILFFLPGVCANAQNPALLSLIALGSNKSDKIDNQVVVTEDGGFIIRISSQLFTNGNIPSCHAGINNYQQLFQKYDSTGELQWQRCYPNFDSSTNIGVQYIYPANNGEFYAIARLFGTGTTKFLILKEDGAQNVLWTGVPYGGAINLIPRVVDRASDGGFFLAFTSNNIGGDVTTHYGSTMWEDIWVLKLDSLGNKVWERTIGGSYIDYPRRILPTPEGGCYVIGQSDSYDYDCTDNHGSYDAFVVKLDSAGGTVWSKSYGSTAWDQADFAIYDQEGDLLIGGAAGANGPHAHNHHGGAADFWLFKIDTAGNYIWDNCFGGSSSEYCYALARSRDNSIWLTGGSGLHDGQIDTSYGAGDCWTLHTDSVGNLLSSKVLGANKLDKGVLLHGLPGGIMLLGGEYSGAGPVGGEFPSTFYGLSSDVFFARLAPWTVSAKSLVAKENISIYPNPAENVIYVQLGRPKAVKLGISLVSSDGKTVHTQEFDGKSKAAIQTSNIAKGIYHLNISDKGKVIRSERVVLR